MAKAIKGHGWDANPKIVEHPRLFQRGTTTIRASETPREHLLKMDAKGLQNGSGFTHDQEIPRVQVLLADQSATKPRTERRDRQIWTSIL